MPSGMSLLVVLGILAWLLFSCLIYPAWVLVFHSKNKPASKTKTIWTIVMLIFWPIAGWLYGLFCTQKRALRIGAAVSLLIFGIFVGSLAAAVPQLFREIEGQGAAIAAGLDQVDMAELSQDEKVQIKSALLSLAQELHDASNLADRFHKMERAVLLYQLFNVYTKDNVLSGGEYNMWMEKFRSQNLNINVFEAQRLHPEDIQRYN